MQPNEIKVMKNQHVSPEEAVKAYLDLQAQIFISMHYGAFRLADDTPREALGRFHKEWKRQELPVDRLRVLKLGETLNVES